MIYTIIPGSCNCYQKTNKTFITTRYQNTNYFIRRQLASPPMTLRIIWIVGRWAAPIEVYEESVPPRTS